MKLKGTLTLAMIICSFNRRIITTFLGTVKIAGDGTNYISPSLSADPNILIHHHQQLFNFRYCNAFHSLLSE